MAVAAAVVSIGAQGASSRQRRKGEKLSRAQTDLSRRTAEIANVRARRKAIAEARQIQAQAKAAAAARGASVTGDENIGAQLGEQLGFSTFQEQSQGAIASFDPLIARSQRKAATFSAIGALPSQFGINPDLSSFLPKKTEEV